MLKNGTLIKFSSFGNSYKGFIIGVCSYDNLEENNAYVVRYVWVNYDEMPRKPYTIVRFDAVELVMDFPEDFQVGGHWSATPQDRCDEWLLVKTETCLFIVPNCAKVNHDD